MAHPARRAYAENWAVIVFLFCSVPYILITGAMVSVELFCIRKWHGGKTRPIKWTAAGLLVFLLSQMIAGILSARTSIIQADAEDYPGTDQKFHLLCAQ